MSTYEPGDHVKVEFGDKESGESEDVGVRRTG